MGKTTTGKPAKKTKFDLMTKAEQRVQIAKDVLKWLRAGKLEPKHMTYINVPTSDALAVGEQVQSFLERNDSCRVCALGATFCAVVLRDNDITMGQLFGLDGKANAQARMLEYLSKYFPQSELAAIENAFESFCGYGRRGGKYFHGNESLRGQPRKRLTIIMKNIIRNGGTFRLSDKTGVA